MCVCIYELLPQKKYVSPFESKYLQNIAKNLDFMIQLIIPLLFTIDRI